MIKRLQPEGKPLQERLLDHLQQHGSITTLEMYDKFKEYKTNSLCGAIQKLRARGYTIQSQPIGKTKSAKFTLMRYVLVKK
jgi:hypothetical protein